jgi:hypothetical protein
MTAHAFSSKGQIVYARQRVWMVFMLFFSPPCLLFMQGTSTPFQGKRYLSKFARRSACLSCKGCSQPTPVPSCFCCAMCKDCVLRHYPQRKGWPPLIDFVASLYVRASAVGATSTGRVLICVRIFERLPVCSLMSMVQYYLASAKPQVLAEHRV